MFLQPNSMNAKMFILARLRNLEECKKELSILFGSIICKEQSLKISADSPEKFLDFLENQYYEVKNMESYVENSILANKRPNWFQRNWFWVFAGVTGAAVIMKGMMILDRERTIQIASDLYQFSQNFIVEWVYKPMQEIWKTIRYSEERIAVTSAKSLTSDLNVIVDLIFRVLKEW